MSPHPHNQHHPSQQRRQNQHQHLSPAVPISAEAEPGYQWQSLESGLGQENHHHDDGDAEVKSNDVSVAGYVGPMMLAADRDVGESAMEAEGAAVVWDAFPGDGSGDEGDEADGWDEFEEGDWEADLEGHLEDEDDEEEAEGVVPNIGHQFQQLQVQPHQVQLNPPQALQSPISAAGGVVDLSRSATEDQELRALVERHAREMEERTAQLRAMLELSNQQMHTLLNLLQQQHLRQQQHHPQQQHQRHQEIFPHLRLPGDALPVNDEHFAQQQGIPSQPHCFPVAWGAAQRHQQAQQESKQCIQQEVLQDSQPALHGLKLPWSHLQLEDDQQPPQLPTSFPSFPSGSLLMTMLSAASAKNPSDGNDCSGSDPKPFAFDPSFAAPLSPDCGLRQQIIPDGLRSTAAQLVSCCGSGGGWQKKAQDRAEDEDPELLLQQLHAQLQEHLLLYQEQQRREQELREQLGLRMHDLEEPLLSSAIVIATDEQQQQRRPVNGQDIHPAGIRDPPLP